MIIPLAVHVTKKTSKVIAAALAGVCLIGQALAADPWLVGPSVLASSQQGTFAGGGFTPGAHVELRVQSPGAAQARQLQVQQDGSLSHTVTVAVAGPHTLTVLDGAGTVLATASFLSR